MRRRWLRDLVAGTTLGLLLVAVAWAVTSTINPVPTSNSTFLTDLQTFLRNEDAQRYVHHFAPFVVQNGLHGTVAGLTGNPGDTIAYPGGFYSRSTASITYPDNDTCWVIMHSDTTGNIASFVRVAGTPYLTDCTSGSLPATPTGTVMLMQVTTASGAVTAVTDLRPRTPVGVASGGTGLGLPYVVGDLLFANTTSTWSRLAAGADGNVLRAAGASVAPLYGKVRLSGATTDITGTLPIGSGGTGVTVAPANGQLLVGNGSGFSLATLTAGANVQITNSAGGIVLASVAPLSTGTYAVRGLRGTNNAGVPNTRYDLAADVVQLRNGSNEIAVQHNVVTVTNDVTLAGPTVNGRDQAAVFASASWVHFYFIWNGATLATISSPNAPPTGPAALPTGYTYWAYATSVRYDATPLLLRTYTRGAEAFYATELALLTAGVATSETLQSLANYVPPNALTARLGLRLRLTATGTVNDTGVLRLLTGGSASFTIRASGQNSGDNETAQIVIPNLSQTFYYLVTATGSAPELSIWVNSYRVPNGDS